MIVCELSFDKPDPKRTDYSLHEVDYFDHAWPPAYRRGGYRLSLRRNLKGFGGGEKDVFEVYRRYHDTQLEEVIFAGNFVKALEKAYEEAIEVCGEEWGQADEPCEHKEPKISIFCPKWPAIRDKKAKE